MIPTAAVYGLLSLMVLQTISTIMLSLPTELPV